MTPKLDNAAICWVLVLATGAVLLMVVPQARDAFHPVLVAAALAAVAHIVAQDWRNYTIPDMPLIALAAVGIGSALLAPAFDAGSRLDAAVFCVASCAFFGGAFWAIREAFHRWHGFDGLGFGDVKLAAAGGMLVAFDGFAWALLGASLTALAFASVSTVLHGIKPAKLPFGAFLAPALLAVWLFETRGS